MHCIDGDRKNRNEMTKSMVLDYTWERREELIRAEDYRDRGKKNAGNLIEKFHANT